MIPELIISGEEANGEFLMLVPGKMLFRVIVPFKIKL